MTATLLVARSATDADGLIGDGVALCGGTDLMVSMRAGQITPVLVDLSRLPGPAVQHLDSGALRLSATASLRQLQTELGGADHSPLPALSAAIGLFAGATIRSRASLGGNLATGSPAADTVPALVAADAVVEIRGRAGRREVPVTEFLLGPRRVDLNNDEWIESVLIGGTGAAARPVGGMRKVAGRRAQAISLVSLAWQWTLDPDGHCHGVRLAMGAVAPTVVRLRAVEAVLEGRAIDPSRVDEAIAVLQGAITPIDDLRASATYRRQCATGLIRELLAAAAPDEVVAHQHPSTPERKPVQ